MNRLDERALPHSEETERAVLAICMLRPEHAVPLVVGKLTTEDFYLDKHQAIYRAILRLHDKGTLLDLRTLQERLATAGKLDAVGGLAYLAGLDLDLPDAGRLETYMGIVRDRAIRRQTILSCQQITLQAFEGESAEHALELATTGLLALGSKAVENDLVPLKVVWEKLADDWDARIDAGGELLGLATGLPDFDRLTLGLCPGQLILIAARTGVGKTALAAGIARHVGIRQNKTVAVFSMEMLDLEVGQRLLAQESGVPLPAVRSAQQTPRQAKAMVETMRRTLDAPILIDESSTLTVAAMAAKLRRVRLERGLDLVIVDYLQLAKGERSRNGNREQEVSSISKALKRLGKDFAVPVVALSQLSRETAKAGDGRPQLHHLRESGSLEQDSDLVVFIHRPEALGIQDPELEGHCELIVAKQRNGPPGSIDLHFDKPTATFSCLDPHREPPAGFEGNQAELYS